MKLVLALSALVFSSTGWPVAPTKVAAVPGEFIVKFKHGLAPTSMKGVSATEEIKLASGEILYKVKGEDLEAVSSLNQDSIDIIEPNYIYTFGELVNHGNVMSDEDSEFTDDPMFGKLWGLRNIGTNTGSLFGGVKGMDVNALEAWKVETGRREVVIAVIDTGIDYNHPDLQANVWRNEAELNGQAGVDDDQNGVIDDVHGFNAITGSGDPLDDHGHGSHCSGTIAAVHGNGVGVKGLMANAQVMGVKFLDAKGSGTLEDAIKAIDYATTKKVDIMSNSWGGGGFSELLKQSIQRASDAGIVFLAAAGNASNNNDKNAEYPAGYQLENVIAVAAHEGGGKRANFSNYGVTSVHIAAPGTNIVSTVKGGGYQAMSGTSMAAPHVSGAVGLLLSKEAGLSPSEIRERLMLTAKKVSSLNATCAAKGRLDTLRLLQNVQTIE